MPKVQTLRLIPLSVMLVLPACVSGPHLNTTPSACATLLPSAWKQGVDSAALPDGNTVGDWIAFSDAQTGKLDVANGRTADAIGIVERCEARDAAALKQSRPKVLGLF